MTVVERNVKCAMNIVRRGRKNGCGMDLIGNYETWLVSWCIESMHC